MPPGSADLHVDETASGYPALRPRGHFHGPSQAIAGGVKRHCAVAIGVLLGGPSGRRDDPCGGHVPGQHFIVNLLTNHLATEARQPAPVAVAVDLRRRQGETGKRTQLCACTGVMNLDDATVGGDGRQDLAVIGGVGQNRGGQPLRVNVHPGRPARLASDGFHLLESPLVPEIMQPLAIGLEPEGDRHFRNGMKLREPGQVPEFDLSRLPAARR